MVSTAVGMGAVERILQARQWMLTMFWLSYFTSGLFTVSENRGRSTYTGAPAIAYYLDRTTYYGRTCYGLTYYGVSSRPYFTAALPAYSTGAPVDARQRGCVGGAV